MRKDVKLGLAVGGMLFGVVLAYVLFFTDNPNPDQTRPSGDSLAIKDPAQTGLGDAAASGTGNTENPAGGLPPANTDNHVAVPPVVGWPGDTTTPPDAGTHTGGTPVAGGAGTGTTPDAAQPWDWSRALDNGAPVPPVITRSTTPPIPGTTDTDRMPGLPPGNTISPPAVAPTGIRDYVVKPGETYWTIARAEYGNGVYWSHIQRANPSVTANRLKAGMTIKVPGKGDVVPATAVTPVMATGPVNEATHYEVKPGDSLERISRTLYGRPDRVAKLYDLNKQTIGPNPAALKPKMVLLLPEPPTKLIPSSPVTPAETPANSIPGAPVAGTNG